MDTTDAFRGLECIDCGVSFDADATDGICNECGGFLDPTYDYDDLSLDRSRLESRAFDSLWRYEELVPFTRESAVSIDEGATPLIESETLASELDIGRVLIKDEARNPTGTFTDRGHALAVTAASHDGASDVALSSTGDGGQAAAAYAGRANLEAHVFVPSRTSFTNKAMVNVHGGDMNVVGGRIGDADAAFEEAIAENGGWHSLQPFVTPYRHEGTKTLLYEIVEQLGWETPDAIVVPTGNGIALVGLYKGIREFERLGLIDERPRLYAAQASGCAPIVEAFDAGHTTHEPIERPDTICGGIEIPDPPASSWMLEALAETDGGAVATDDDQILEAAVTIATTEGIGMAPTSGAAASGAWELAETGAFDRDETVVVLNTGTGNKEADVLRSHLMSQGV